MKKGLFTGKEKHNIIDALKVWKSPRTQQSQKIHFVK